MLVNLRYALTCDAFIGTLASNTCRIMDELRATIGKFAFSSIELYVILIAQSIIDDFHRLVN